jgi:hypothetical protein
MTQQTIDFLKNKYGNSIFTQSASYLIYKRNLPKEDFDLIKENLLSRDDPL